ncbi:bifunctional aspartate kinase/homoserine dehydrogenase I [Psittacicella hinzii]|uniref:Bifunctional aspartokinase/homoserine dehydrogenase n=1 Tax=Psittacicella hinzii TaxID=2028575 RepID=A0A3A1YRH7_9GAMM|nr:bifunctional aspartate kinase/homoserine dehydrogenase I [Psittacicella hinzii]RIY39859.1 bifunctional aspartate kinase/homoserine dehydrogenase I [Psittacicella hinzii]
MKVLKFGGTSVANAACFMNVAKIVRQAYEEQGCAVVLSAPAKVTNLLHAAIGQAQANGTYRSSLGAVEDIVYAIVDGLAQAENREGWLLGLSSILNEVEESLKALCINKRISDKEFAYVVSAGERCSIFIMQRYLQQLGLETDIILPWELIVAKDNNYLEAEIDVIASKENFKRLELARKVIHLMPGFTAGNTEHEIMLLGRNGSDYSASLLAACIDASACEIWTDVDGVFTCDPNLVSDALLLNELSYQEAMELSYFGAKVLHPKTMAPIAQFKIPCFIKNVNNPSAVGTVIVDASQLSPNQQHIKGITALNNIAMFNVSGPAMIGQVGIAAKIFNSVSQAGVSLILITQSSSEYSIGFCCREQDADKCKAALEKTFATEIAQGSLDPIEVQRDLAIVSVIGDNMKNLKGIAAKFFSALAQTNVSIIAIAQGSSERAISTVIRASQVTESVRATHRMLFNSKQIIRAYIIGVGGVGSELINQILRQKEYLASKNIEISINGIANSRKWLLDPKGLNLDDNWRNKLEEEGQEYTLSDFIRRVEIDHVVNPVFVDCTSNQGIADSYVRLLEAGFNIVTPNKKANTSSYAYYQQMRNVAQREQRRLMYETNVGAGLPVIENLQNLIAAGDEIEKFNGILSGSLSYIFGELETGKTLSEVTKMARDKGFTEPDPRDDLSGQDVARKLLILAREAGLQLELSDIKVEPVLPDGFAQGLNTEEFMRALPQLDAEFSARVEACKAAGKVMRYVGEIDGNVCRVRIMEVGTEHPLFKVKGGENALAFYTRYYNPIPLLLRGYGAGNDVTAAGIFSDILRTLQSYGGVR